MLLEFPVKKVGEKAYKLGHPKLHTCNMAEMELTCFDKKSVMALVSFPT